MWEVIHKMDNYYFYSLESLEGCHIIDVSPKKALKYNETQRVLLYGGHLTISPCWTSLTIIIQDISGHLNPLRALMLKASVFRLHRARARTRVHGKTDTQNHPQRHLHTFHWRTPGHMGEHTLTHTDTGLWSTILISQIWISKGSFSKVKCAIQQALRALNSASPWSLLKKTKRKIFDLICPTETHQHHLFINLGSNLHS